MIKQIELTEKTKSLVFTALNDLMISVWDGKPYTYTDYSKLAYKERYDTYYEFRDALRELGLKMRRDVAERH